MLNHWRKAQAKEERFYRNIERSPVDSELYTKELKKIWANFSSNLEDIREKNVLEVGCGSKGIIHYLGGGIGIDPLCSKYKRFYKEFETPHITGIGEKLPFKNNSFDIILSINVLDHTINPEQTLSEIRRTLKKGGFLLLQVDVFRNMPNLLMKKLSVIDRLHAHHFSPQKIKTLLKGQFSVKKVTIKNFEKKKIQSEVKRGHIVSGLKMLAATMLGAKEFYLIAS